MTTTEPSPQTPPAAPQIYAKMAAIMTEIGPIAKTRSASEGPKYKYRGIEDVINAAAPVFQKHGVFMTFEMASPPVVGQEVANGKPRTKVVLHVRGKFYATDGSFVTSEAVGEAFDYGDKASNKAMSVAQRYLILQILMVPTMQIDNEASEPREPGAPPENQNTDSSPMISAQFRSHGVKPADFELVCQFLMLNRNVTLDSVNPNVLLKNLAQRAKQGDVTQQARDWANRSVGT